MPGEEETKKKERRMKSKFLCLVFWTLLKDSGTNTVDLALQQREVVCKLLNSSASFFWELFLYLMYSGHVEPSQSLTKKYYRTSWHYSLDVVWLKVTWLEHAYSSIHIGSGNLFQRFEVVGPIDLIVWYSILCFDIHVTVHFLIQQQCCTLV